MRVVKGKRKKKKKKLENEYSQLPIHRGENARVNGEKFRYL
jgi:hypothetical protein